MAKLRSLKIPSVNKDVEEAELSEVTGANAKWYR